MLNQLRRAVVTCLAVVVIGACGKGEDRGKAAAVSGLDPSDYVDALVLVDSQYVAVEEAGKITSRLDASDGAYFSGRVRYDPQTDFISIVQCSTLSRDHWWFKSMVWDYKTDTMWIIMEGETWFGERYVLPVAFHYDHVDDVGIIQTYGWEWCGVTYYNKGTEDRIKGLEGWDGVTALCIPSQDHVIVSALDEIDIPEGETYFEYSWKDNILKRVGPDELTNYRDSILRDTGRNILVTASDLYQSEGKHFGGIHWNPGGEAFTYTERVSPGEEVYRLRLYDYLTKTDTLLAENHIAYAVVWKESDPD